MTDSDKHYKRMQCKMLLIGHSKECEISHGAMSCSKHSIFNTKVALNLQ